MHQNNIDISPPNSLSLLSRCSLSIRTDGICNVFDCKRLAVRIIYESAVNRRTDGRTGPSKDGSGSDLGPLTGGPVKTVDGRAASGSDPPVRLACSLLARSLSVNSDTPPPCHAPSRRSADSSHRRHRAKRLEEEEEEERSREQGRRMNQEQQSVLLRSASLFPLPPGAKFSYGTSGFRADASLLESTVFRVGILAALRSIQTRSVIGLMITASHNEVSDNGVKLADPSGGMLTQSWEPFADALANAPDPHSLLQLLDDFIKKENIILEGASAEVLLGRDTRPSGERLLEAAKQGITSLLGATALDMGIVTTPQLHWMVRAKNKGIEATELNYFDQILTSFSCLLDYIPQGDSTKNVSDKLIVDGADGVGGEKLDKLKTRLGNVIIDVRNCGDGVLNEGVGADYVQKEKVVPRSFSPADAGMRCASLDGDADRLVYFSVISNSNKINLVDGDKILSLFALFIKEQLCILNGPEDAKANNSYQASLGVVQTAYANGASTDYLKQMGLEVVLTPTGVKYLHEKADEYDIGIYFEANGHGTILFSDKFLSWLEIKNQELSSTSKDSVQHKAALRLLAVSRLINQAVGDALSGLFLVEAILKHLGWSIHKWNELYRDLPSRQLKVKVADRTAVITENAETKVASPAGIQEAIDAETVKYPKGRCFIRPSGTEDVVRVYAEASTQEAADGLAKSVVRLVEQHLGFGRS